MAIHDITLPLHPEHPPWPGDPAFSLEPLSQISQGDECNISRIEMSSHFATHLDAPFHFINDGAKLDEIPIDVFVGPALVHEVDTPGLIHPQHLPSLHNIERILFKTSNSNINTDTQFHIDYVSLSLEAAKEITKAGIKLVGIDYFSIEAFKSPGHPVHQELCANGLIIVEGLNLRDIRPGMYDLTVLPLKLQGGDGGPCRAILRDLIL